MSGEFLMCSTPVRVLARALCVLLALTCIAGCGQAEPVKPLPPATALQSHARQFDGQICSIVDGDAYLQDPGAKTWKFYMHLYDNDFFKKNYVVENDVIYRIDPGSGKRYAMSKHFKADFENVATLQDLIGEKHGFTSFVLQSPSAPTVADYVKLRTAILKNERSFIDNRVEPSTEKAHSGKQALKAHAVAPSRSMQCSKAHIESELLHFVKGDDYWFSGWYFISEGMPYTIADIKSGWIEGTPGLRLRLEDGRAAIGIQVGRQTVLQANRRDTGQVSGAALGARPDSSKAVRFRRWIERTVDRRKATDSCEGPQPASAGHDLQSRRSRHLRRVAGRDGVCG